MILHHWVSWKILFSLTLDVLLWALCMSPFFRHCGNVGGCMWFCTGFRYFNSYLSTFMVCFHVVANFYGLLKASDLLWRGLLV